MHLLISLFIVAVLVHGFRKRRAARRADIDARPVSPEPYYGKTPADLAGIMQDVLARAELAVEEAQVASDGIAVKIVEPFATTIVSRDIIAPVQPIVGVPTISASKRHRTARPSYLLDAADAHHSDIDRVARLQRKMRGRGVCSPG